MRPDIEYRISELMDNYDDERVTFSFNGLIESPEASAQQAWADWLAAYNAESPAVRRYIAQRAELLGAIRLPNNTFKSAAGAIVTSDILFLQMRERPVNAEPEWVHLNRDENIEAG